MANIIYDWAGLFKNDKLKDLMNHAMSVEALLGQDALQLTEALRGHATPLLPLNRIGEVISNYWENLFFNVIY